jgi:hypothetical protein
MRRDTGNLHGTDPEKPYRYRAKSLLKALTLIKKHRYYLAETLLFKDCRVLLYTHILNSKPSKIKPPTVMTNPQGSISNIL